MDKLYNPKIHSSSQAKYSQDKEISEKANQLLICYDVDAKTPIEVLKVNYNLIIKPGMVIAQIEQFYQSNQSQKPIELEYLFCIDENAAVTQMIVEIGDQKAYGIIKEKEEAIKEYKEGIQQQKTMAYSEQNQEFPDIKTVKIGQLQPKQNLKITFEYIHPPKIFLNKFWQVDVRPMVDSNLITVSTLKNTRQNYPNLYAFINQKVNLSLINKNYSQDIVIDIDIDQQVKFVKSPTHQIQVEQIQQKLNAKDKDITRIKLENTKENHSPQKEFTLLFTTDQINKSKVYLTHSKNDAFQQFKYCATLTFVPDFFEMSVEDAYQQYIDDLNITSQKGTKAKFIFLIDRSGSMDGERIAKAKEALIIFLKSLPSECEFNIVSYGSRYVTMAEDSMPNCYASMEFAINYVNQMKADMGGTDIYKVIKEVICDKQNTNNPETQLNVFLLTDGEDRPDQIIDLVQKNKRPETRFYTLGIGSGCNKFLIRRIAEVGNGKYHFAESEDIDSKVIDLLEDSLSPYLKAIYLSTNVQQIHQIIPDPESLITLKRNEELTIQILFSSKQKSDNLQFDLKCFDPFNNKQLNHQVTINLKEAIENEYFHKFAGHKLIKLYEDAEKFNLPTLQVKYKQQNLSSQDIINHSIQYQILSSKTAFVCVVCQNEKKQAEEKKKKIIIEKYVQKIEPPKFYDQCYQIQSLCCSIPRKQSSMIPKQLFSSQQENWMVQQDYFPTVNLNCDQNTKNIQLMSFSPKQQELISNNMIVQEKKAQEQNQIKNYLEFNDLDIVAQPDGRFIFDKNLSQFFAKVEKIFQNLNTIQIQTIIGLFYLEYKFPEKKKTWKLIYQKGVSFLQSEKLNFLELKKQYFTQFQDTLAQ